MILGFHVTFYMIVIITLIIYKHVFTPYFVFCIILDKKYKFVVSFLDIEVTVTHYATQQNTAQKKKKKKKGKRHYNQRNKQQHLMPILSLVSKILRCLCCAMSFRRWLWCLRWLHGVKIRLPALGHAWRWSCIGCNIRSITVQS